MNRDVKELPEFTLTKIMVLHLVFKGYRGFRLYPGTRSKLIIFGSLFPLLKWVSFFEAAGVVEKLARVLNQTSK